MHTCEPPCGARELVKLAQSELRNHYRKRRQSAITVGVLRPVGRVATACDGHNCLAMLIRRHGETLAQLLSRLDQAIEKALTEDIFTDEVNAR